MAVTKLHIEALDILADDLPNQKFKYLLAVIQIVRKPPANRYSNFRSGNLWSRFSRQEPTNWSAYLAKTRPTVPSMCVESLRQYRAQAYIS